MRNDDSKQQPTVWSPTVGRLTIKHHEGGVADGNDLELVLCVKEKSRFKGVSLYPHKTHAELTPPSKEGGLGGTLVRDATDDDLRFFLDTWRASGIPPEETLFWKEHFGRECSLEVNSSLAPDVVGIDWGKAPLHEDPRYNGAPIEYTEVVRMRTTALRAIGDQLPPSSDDPLTDLFPLVTSLMDDDGRLQRMDDLRLGQLVIVCTKPTYSEEIIVSLCTSLRREKSRGPYLERIAQGEYNSHRQRPLVFTRWPSWGSLNNTPYLQCDTPVIKGWWRTHRVLRPDPDLLMQLFMHWNAPSPELIAWANTLPKTDAFDRIRLICLECASRQKET